MGVDKEGRGWRGGGGKAAAGRRARAGLGGGGASVRGRETTRAGRPGSAGPRPSRARVFFKYIRRI